MSRRVPADFAEKAAVVEAAVSRELGRPRRDFSISEAVEADVRLVATQAGDDPVVFTLWTDERDVAAICGDAAYPATAGLLAVDKGQVAGLGRRGVEIDLAALVRSETLPGMYYTLLDHLSELRLREVIEVLVRTRPGESPGRRS